MNFDEIIDKMIECEASDIFIRAGTPLRGRIYTEIKILTEDRKSTRLNSSHTDISRMQSSA